MRLKYYTLEVSAEGRFAFVPSGQRGLYVRTHIAAAFTDCPNATCAAKRGHPCLNLTKLAVGFRQAQSTIHPERRLAYRNEQASARAVDDDGKVIPIRRARRRAK